MSPSPEALFTLDGARPGHPEVAAWLDTREGMVGEIVRDLFDRIRRIAPGAGEVMHDHQATACFEGAAFAYVGAYRAHANLGFFHGAGLPDPAGLLHGTGVRMRHVKVKVGGPADWPAIEALILAAWRDIQARAGARSPAGFAG